MTTRQRNPAGTQEEMVLEALQEALDGVIGGPYTLNGGWLNKLYFIRVMGLTQAGRAIFNLENGTENRKAVEIEHSSFKDEFGFKYYRLKVPLVQQHLL